MNEEETQTTVNTPIGGFSFRGKRIAEFIAILCLACTSAGGAMFYQHTEETKSSAKTLESVIERMVLAQNAMAVAQREQNCLLSLPQDKREKEYFSADSFCKRMSR